VEKDIVEHLVERSLREGMRVSGEQIEGHWESILELSKRRQGWRKADDGATGIAA